MWYKILNIFSIRYDWLDLACVYKKKIHSWKLKYPLDLIRPIKNTFSSRLRGEEWRERESVDYSPIIKVTSRSEKSRFEADEEGEIYDEEGKLAMHR